MQQMINAVSLIVFCAGLNCVPQKIILGVVHVEAALYGLLL